MGQTVNELAKPQDLKAFDPKLLGVRDGHRVSVIMDGASVFMQARDLNFEMNYSRLLSLLSDPCDLDINRAFYFAMVPLDPETHSPVRKLADFLDFNGYRVVMKNFQETFDAEGRTTGRRNCTVEVATEMLDSAQTVDTILLFATDPELVYAVERCQQKGARVVLVGNNREGDRATAEELRRAVDGFVELSVLKPYVMHRTIDSDKTVRRPHVARSEDRPQAAVVEEPEPDVGEAIIIDDRRGSRHGGRLSLRGAR